MSDIRHKTVPDVIAPRLRLLICGINPGLYSAAVGYNFARPGNRFWPTLAGAGLTPRQLAPSEQRELLTYGIGITNIVERTTAKASELSREELRAGRLLLEAKVAQYQPGVVAVLGVTAYRDAFDKPKATLGLQSEPLARVPVWVLPNPSGLNAHYQLPALIELFRECRLFALSRANTWAVWRQDDNGNRFKIQGGLSRTDAQSEVERFTALKHKQLYWAEPDAPE